MIQQLCFGRPQQSQECYPYQYSIFLEGESIIRKGQGQGPEGRLVVADAEQEFCPLAINRHMAIRAGKRQHIACIRAQYGKLIDVGFHSVGSIPRSYRRPLATALQSQGLSRFTDPPMPATPVQLRETRCAWRVRRSRHDCQITEFWHLAPCASGRTRQPQDLWRPLPQSPVRSARPVRGTRQVLPRSMRRCAIPRKNRGGCL